MTLQEEGEKVCQDTQVLFIENHVVLDSLY